MEDAENQFENLENENQNEKLDDEDLNIENNENEINEEKNMDNEISNEINEENENKETVTKYQKELKNESETESKKESKKESKTESKKESKTESKKDLNLEVNNNNQNNISTLSNKILITEVKENLPQRKDYLNEKLKKLNISEILKRGVSSGILKTNENIRNDFMSFKLDVNKKARNINSILDLKDIDSSKVLSKERLKQLKQLKVSEENTKVSLKKLEVNRQLILEESQKGIKSGIVEENIRKAKINDIDDKKKILERKLENINIQVEKIFDNNKPSKKELINKFLENFEKNKSEYKLKVKEYEKKTNEIKLKMEQDKMRSSEKRENEFNKKEKEDLEKKERLFNERKEKEKQIVLKRKKEIDDKMEKTKQYIKEKLEKSERDYLYNKNKEKFELQEMQLINRINMQKKEIITQEEIKELSDKIKEQKEILEQESKEKSIKLHEMWNNRSQVLPNYKSQISKICEEEDKEKYNLNLKKEKIALLEKEKLEYSKKNIPKTYINPKLKQIREKKLIKIDKNNVLLTEKNNRERNEIFYIQPPKRKNPIITLSNDMERYDESLDEEINVLISKRPKKFLKPLQILHPPLEKPINYLDELIRNRRNEGKYKKRKKFKINFNNTEVQTGNKVLEQINMIKAQTDLLDNEVQQKKEYMKLNGGYQKNPLMGDKLGDMLIESIHAKIDVINQLNGD